MCTSKCKETIEKTNKKSESEKDSKDPLKASFSLKILDVKK